MATQVVRPARIATCRSSMVASSRRNAGSLAPAVAPVIASRFMSQPSLTDLKSQRVPVRKFLKQPATGPAHLLSRGEGLRHIGDEIVRMLDTDRCSDQGWRDPDLAPRLFRQPRMHRRRRMANQ